MSLIHWWPLNGDLKDYGLNPVALENNGATVTTNGILGSCYTFDGNTSYLSVTSSDLYQIFGGGNKQFSICFWFYNNDTSGRSIFFGDYNLSGTQQFNIEKTAQELVRLYWAGDGSVGVMSSTTLSTNAWNHVTITYSGTQVKCYINGVEKYTKTVTLPTKTKTTGSWWWGRDQRTGTTALNGRFNDLRIYDHCLSKKEIKNIYQCLLIHYNFELPSSNTIVLDNSGYNNNATTVQNLTIGSTTKNGSKSAVFNGSNSYIEKIINLQANLSMTFACWVKFDDTGSYHIWDCRTSGGTGYQPFYGGVNYGLQFYSSNAGSVQPSAAECGFNTTDWFFLTGVVTPTNTSVYINGQLIKSGTGTKTTDVSNALCRLGTRLNGSNWFKGKIADARVYMTALSADDIKQLYNCGLSIDKDHNWYSQYIEEDTNNLQITKNLQVKATNVQENLTSKFYTNYTLLDYIENTSASHINTGVSGNNVNLRIVADYQSSNNNQTAIFSARTSSSAGISFWTDGYCHFGNSSSLISGVSKSGRHTVDLSKNGLWWDGTKLNFTAGSSMQNSDLVLFRVLGDNRIFIGKIYSVQIYDGINLIRDLWPAKRNSDNAIGMYDKVNNVFYPNAGTGTFTYNETLGSLSSIVSNQLIEI